MVMLVYQRVTMEHHHAIHGKDHELNGDFELEIPGLVMSNIAIENGHRNI